MSDRSRARKLAIRYGKEYDYDRDVVDRAVTAVSGDGLRAELGRFLDEGSHHGRDLTAMVLAEVEGADALPALLAAAARDLGDHPHDLMRAIDLVLGEHRSDSRSVLRGLIEAGSAVALELFPKVALESDADILAVCLAAGDPRIRCLALHSLAAGSLPLIIGALRDPDQDVRLGAIQRLADLGPAEAVPPLVTLATDPSPQVRSKVAQALGRLRAASAQSTLESLLQDPDQLVRDRARAALAEIGGDSVIDALLAEAGADDARKRAQAAKALAQVVDEDPRAEERLRALADDPNADVRSAVLSGLATVGDKSGRWSSLVVTLSADPDRGVRHRVANTVRHLMPDPSAVLAALAADSSGFVREAVR